MVRLTVPSSTQQNNTGGRNSFSGPPKTLPGKEEGVGKHAPPTIAEANDPVYIQQQVERLDKLMDDIDRFLALHHELTIQEGGSGFWGGDRLTKTFFKREKCVSDASCSTRLYADALRPGRPHCCIARTPECDVFLLHNNKTATEPKSLVLEVISVLVGPYDH